MSRLFAVLLGGSGGEGRLAEDHETVFVVAQDAKAAKAQAKAKWSGSGRPHVDALIAVDVVDGHAVSLVPTGEVGDAELVDFNDRPHDEAWRSTSSALSAWVVIDSSEEITASTV